AHGLRSVIAGGFAGVWLMRFVFAIALSASLLFSLYMFTDRWDIDRVAAVQLVTLVTLVGTVGVVTAALVLTVVRRSRWDDRQLLAGAYVVLAIALAVCGLAPTIHVFIASTFGAGVAIGI